MIMSKSSITFFFFRAEDCIRAIGVTGVQTCALPILKTLVGDVLKDPAAFAAVSPLAQAGKITQPLLMAHGAQDRSEERRVGKECKCRRGPCRNRKQT